MLLLHSKIFRKTKSAALLLMDVSIKLYVFTSFYDILLLDLNGNLKTSLYMYF